MRLHHGLLDSNRSSRLLTQVPSTSKIPFHESYPVSGFTQIRTNLYNARQKLFVKRKRLESFEPLESPYRIHETQAYNASELVNLHWTTRFLDYPSFFKYNKKPVIWTLHDQQTFSGGLPYPMETVTSSLRKRMMKNIEAKQKLLRDQDIHVVCLCSWMEQASSESEVFGGFPHYRIPNGIDTTIFRLKDRTKYKKKLGISKDSKLVLFVSDSLKNKRKGFDILLRAIDQREFRNTKFVAVGKANKELPPDIMNTGYINDENELSDIYNAADLFVIPSRADNLPNTILESLCCGTPVVGFNIGGIPDLIADGINGSLVDEVNAEQLRKTIIENVNHSWDNESISKDAIKKFNMKRQATDYIDLFSGILNKNK